MKPRIFLTGSTSYVGTKFVDLYGKKFDILGLARHDVEHPIDLLDFDLVGRTFKDFNPDLVIHLAADVGRDTTSSEEIIKTNPAMLKNLIELALPNKTPIIFTSTEAVYGGKEQIGSYIETDSYKPRSPYGQSKVVSEKQLKASGLPFLITRGHRHVGISPRFKGAKWFPDTIKDLQEGKTVHLDASKIFSPVLINNVCDIFNHYIDNDLDKRIILNVGLDEKITYFQLLVDIAKALGLDVSLIKNDGNEAGWPQDSSISVKKLRELDYPYIDYEQMIQAIKADFS